MDNKKKTLAIVFGIFALVIVTTAASFAFFTYSRTGNTKATIISGDIEFSYIEGDSAELTNAFPVADSIGAIDTTGEYDFQVKLNSSGTTTASYNVYLVDNNTSTNHFTNEQIKFALIKNDVYVANTSATEGVKLSSISGFNEGVSKGEGIVLEDQEISSGETDNYKLRIWISDDVSYNNDYQTDGTMEGKYNSYTYSLKVKVTSGLTNNISIGSISVNKRTITADISDPNGLVAYAVTTSSSTPEESEWIEITSDTAKSNVVRTTNELITSKTITFTGAKLGKNYLHVKNNNNEIKTKSFTTTYEGQKATTEIVNLASTNTNELRIDTHAATGQQNFPVTEYRYWGATPNNYVKFNNELWRIIGVFDVDDGTSKVEQRVKLIRNESIGDLAWDTSTYNSGYGINEWTQADLKILLNEGDYYNRLNTYSTTGLTTEAKRLIGNAKWYLGAHTTNIVNTPDIYKYERSIATGKQCTQGTDYCNDNVTRKTSWVGGVGLMYPSDYGYAADMTSCGATNLNSYNISCAATNWLFKSGIYQWTLSPYAYSSYATHTFDVDLNGNFGYNCRANNTYSARPATYLLPDIKIVDGTGTETNPFILEK